MALNERTPNALHRAFQDLYLLETRKTRLITLAFLSRAGQVLERFRERSEIVLPLLRRGGARQERKKQTSTRAPLLPYGTLPYRCAGSMLPFRRGQADHFATQFTCHLTGAELRRDVLRYSAARPARIPVQPHQSGGRRGDLRGHARQRRRAALYLEHCVVPPAP
jgi:hypothetical protein